MCPLGSNKAFSARKDRLQKESSPRQRVPRDKRMTYRIRCWLLVEDSGTVIETTTADMSKSGLLVRALSSLPVGQRVLILLLDQPKVTAEQIRANKFVMKGKVVRVETQDMMYRMGIHITLGRPNPVAEEPFVRQTRYWWTRRWRE
jgi:hypothetical protein